MKEILSVWCVFVSATWMLFRMPLPESEWRFDSPDAEGTTPDRARVQSSVMGAELPLQMRLPGLFDGTGRLKSYFGPATAWSFAYRSLWQ